MQILVDTDIITADDSFLTMNSTSFASSHTFKLKMRSLVYSLLLIIHKLPISQRIWLICERFSAAGQGKGWGTETIAEEVTACCSLLSDRPRLLIDIGGNKGDYSLEFLR